jgi:hypothetical protein
MRIPGWALVLVLIPVCAAAQGAAAGRKAWGFDGDKAGVPPAGFDAGRTGSGPAGRWVVETVAGAPSGGHVLAQADADDTDDRFPVATAAGVSLKDVDLSVKCRMVSGKVDRACGLVWRYKDADNYYVTRANALEDNVRLYYVKDGKRKQIASWSGKVTAGTWHAYRVVARDRHVQVWWDGRMVIETDDGTFTAPGTVGVWTKADSVTQFDDLAVEAP